MTDTIHLKAKAEDFKNRGNDALAKKKYDKAIELYTEAIKINPSSAVYQANRSAALYSSERYENSLEGAYNAIRLDAAYAKAWSRYGLAAAHKNAIALAAKDVTASMRLGLTCAGSAHTATLKAIEDEPDKEKKDVLRKDFKDQDFETTAYHVAERMKWPWINDVCDHAEEAYSNLRGGQVILAHLHDWLFDTKLLGQWFSFKIMTALILCLPAMDQTSPGIAHAYDCGLSMPGKSYWRIRTVRGRVLGCLSNVTSLCGWLGPCLFVGFLRTGCDEDDDDAALTLLSHGTSS
ncbi:MAG: hypothetical protein M1829_005372 [Trizodia sp. TS-e1964]|nr:MAG: hypothetical protein M1829_005372 [Trizodia sp. TS-e1964]